jgi:MYXO-CTERM domain-containing protein
MTIRKGSILVGAALSIILFSSPARAHWCDDLWASSYNIVVRPDSDTSPKEVYVQNNMGYQLINFKLTATSGSGAITLTAPTLKVSGTLLPGEKGTWKIASGSPAKIEDITFDVSFGNTTAQSACYPTKGAQAVMIVKTDGSLYPSPPPPGLDNPQNPGCVGDLQQGRSLQYEAVADFEDVNTGLDKLLQLYCAGRGSWNSGSEAVTPTYCKDTSSTTCPAAKSGSGSKYDYMHLWSAGELAIRKSALGARAAVFRARLQCGTADSDLGFAGYAMFILGYLGDDAATRTWLETQASGSGDLATIAKAALYMMGDTARKADVQAAAKSSSQYFVQMACAAALGIVDNDDATITSTLIPAVKWIEPDTSDDGKGMYAAHLLELVAFARRGWVEKGVGTGAVTFYGETGSAAGGTGGGSGGNGGSGGVTGSGGAAGSGGTTSSGGTPGSGGRSAAGGRSGTGGTSSGSGGTTVGAGGTASSGDAVGSGGTVSAGGSDGSGGSQASGGSTANSGGASGSGGSSSASNSGGVSGGSNGASSSGGNSGGSSSSGNAGGSSGGSSTRESGNASGCTCNAGGGAGPSALSILAAAALGVSLVRRRRRSSDDSRRLHGSTQ